jgi:condensin complex subunit 3
MKTFDSVKAVFNVAQTSSQHEETLFKALDKLAKSSKTPDEFLKDFIHNLKYCMIVFQKEPAVERMMDFVAIYATGEAKSQTEVRKFNKKYKINLHVLMFIV